MLSLSLLLTLSETEEGRNALAPMPGFIPKHLSTHLKEGIDYQKWDVNLKQFPRKFNPPKATLNWTKVHFKNWSLFCLRFPANSPGLIHWRNESICPSIHLLNEFLWTVGANCMELLNSFMFCLWSGTGHTYPWWGHVCPFHVNFTHYRMCF